MFFVAVPIRMTAVKLKAGLLLYAPVAATAECIALVRELEAEHGPVVSIVHPTSSGLEHKVGVPAMARAFPSADVWVTPGQWSFPLPLPLSWLGFPARRTKVLFDDGVPHGDELHWSSLVPAPGAWSFCEATVLHRASGSLLAPDGLIASVRALALSSWISTLPPLYRGSQRRHNEPMDDRPHRRLRGGGMFVWCCLPPGLWPQAKRAGGGASLFVGAAAGQDFAAISQVGAARVAPILEDL